eukprot:TRINITY_DN65718_c10_g1_i2.p1 TRINITY_DN65718_c10_g1~~TRINITY_DN65718_c10_g1_i2.p1  ORF type:complete len:819 (-),score=419.78 TRINITY_DN65718_c10_g1_i2:36-2492(-)
MQRARNSVSLAYAHGRVSRLVGHVPRAYASGLRPHGANGANVRGRRRGATSSGRFRRGGSARGRLRVGNRSGSASNKLRGHSRAGHSILTWAPRQRSFAAVPHSLSMQSLTRAKSDNKHSRALRDRTRIDFLQRHKVREFEDVAHLLSANASRRGTFADFEQYFNVSVDELMSFQRDKKIEAALGVSSNPPHEVRENPRTRIRRRVQHLDEKDMALRQLGHKVAFSADLGPHPVSALHPVPAALLQQQQHQHRQQQQQQQPFDQDDKNKTKKRTALSSPVLPTRKQSPSIGDNSNSSNNTRLLLAKGNVKLMRRHQIEHQRKLRHLQREHSFELSSETLQELAMTHSPKSGDERNDASAAQPPSDDRSVIFESASVPPQTTKPAEEDSAELEAKPVTQSDSQADLVAARQHEVMEAEAREQAKKPHDHISADAITFLPHEPQGGQQQNNKNKEKVDTSSLVPVQPSSSTTGDKTAEQRPGRATAPATLSSSSSSSSSSAESKRNDKETKKKPRRRTVRFSFDGVQDAPAARPRTKSILKHNQRMETWVSAMTRVYRERQKHINHLQAKLKKGTRLVIYHETANPVDCWIQLSEDGSEIGWGADVAECHRVLNHERTLWERVRRKKITTFRVLADAQWIKFGPHHSWRFDNYIQRRGKPWLCFTLKFPDQTVDFLCNDEQQVTDWFLGLQSLIPLSKEYTTLGSMLWLRAQMKIMYTARELMCTPGEVIERVYKKAVSQVIAENKNKQRRKKAAKQKQQEEQQAEANGSEDGGRGRGGSSSSTRSNSSSPRSSKRSTGIRSRRAPANLTDVDTFTSNNE